MKGNWFGLFVVLMLYSLGALAQEDKVVLNQYGQEVERTDVDADTRNSILTFESKDGDYRFWMDNRVYFDAGLFFDKKALNPIGNGLNIRRARMAVKTKMHKNWYGEIDLDFAGAAMEMKDMIIKYTNDANSFSLKGGHFKEGFSMETTTTSRYLTFVERSLISKITPSRHLGFQATYGKEKYLLIGGLHFNKQGEFEEVEFSKKANKKQGTDEGYSLTGRLVVRPIIDMDKLLHLGAAFSYRTPKTDLEIPNSYRYSTRSISSINRKKYIDTDDILDVDNNVLFNVELAGAYKNLMFQSQYMTSTVNRIGDLKPVHLSGFYAQAGYLLFGGSYRYNKMEGEFTQLKMGRSKGEMEVAFRYDYVNANDKEAEIYGGSAEAYTLGLNYYFNTNVKLMLDYSYLNHDRYANGKGKLFVGTDKDGRPTKKYGEVTEAAGKGGDDFGQFQMRVEIDF